MEHILYYFLYSCLGWVCECLYCGIPAGHFINRGFLAGPYCPIYGCGAVLVVYVLEPFQDHIVVLFLAGMILTSILEYVTSYLMEKLFHSKWWDYSNRRFNLHGRICLRNSLLFGVMGIVVVRIVHPFMASLLGRVPLVWQFSFFFDRHDLSDALNVTLAIAEWRAQPHIDDLLRHLTADDALTKRQHIGIIVLSGEPCAQRITAQGTADAFDLVGRNGNTDTGAAHDDAALTFAARHCLCAW